MDLQQFIILIILIILPSIYQRLKFEFNKKSFLKTRLREGSNLQIHHGHWGALCVFIGTFMLIFWQRNTLTIGLSAYGWGLILDEIIPWLKMPSIGRDAELRIYGETKKSSLILIGIVVILCFTLYFS